MVELIGHKNHLNDLLDKYKNNNLHSSIILHGPKGIGKRLFAENLIKEFFNYYLEGKNLSHHFNLIKNNTHPNIKILEKEYDQKTKKIKRYISINQIRNLKNFIKTSSSISNLNKFIIIDSADDLNDNSSNSFLKTLEEPNINTYIFLISHRLSSLLPTLRSRCLKIKFNNHNINDFKNILNAKFNQIHDNEISFLYDLTYGSPGQAISFYEDNILDYFEETINSLSSLKINNLNIKLAHNLSKLDNDQFKSYLIMLKSILIFLSKIKYNDSKSNNYSSNKYSSLENLSKSLSFQKIIDRFEYLSNNESELFTYNLDKKNFMLNFLSS